MKVNQIMPVIYTNELNDTIEFYSNIIGMTCTTDSVENWAIMKMDQAQLMIALPNAHLEFNSPSFTGSFYFEIDDAEDFWNLVKEKVNVLYPLEEFDYGMREFGIYDNNGYLLQFGQRFSTIN